MPCPQPMTPKPVALVQLVAQKLMAPKPAALRPVAPKPVALPQSVALPALLVCVFFVVDQAQMMKMKKKRKKMM